MDKPKFGKIIAYTRPKLEINCWYKNMIGHVLPFHPSSNPNMVKCNASGGACKNGKMNVADLDFENISIFENYMILKNMSMIDETSFEVGKSKAGRVSYRMISTDNMKWRFTDVPLHIHLGKDVQYVSLSELSRNVPEFKGMTMEEIHNIIITRNGNSQKQSRL